MAIMAKTLDEIALEVRDVLNYMYTEKLVLIYNAYCDDNDYCERVYSMDDLNYEIEARGWKARDILLNVDDEFNINENYFYINENEDLFSFDYFDSPDSPIDIDALAKYIVENDADYGEDEIAEILYCKKVLRERVRYK